MITQIYSQESNLKENLFQQASLPTFMSGCRVTLSLTGTDMNNNTQSTFKTSSGDIFNE